MTSDKGRIFKATDAKRLYARDPVRAEQWAKQQTERMRIVAVDPVKGPLIREEIKAFAVQRLSTPNVRRVVGMMMRMSPTERKEVGAQFDADGKHVLPWKLMD